jgi:hypothetical protein
MTEKQLATMYAEARAAVGKQPDPSELIAWRNVLGRLFEADVRSALVTWQNDTNPAGDGTDRRRGETMPKAVSLKAIVEGRQRANESSGEFRGCARTIQDAQHGELICSSGALYLRTIHQPTGNSQIRFIRDCQCWHRWQSTRQAA